MTLLRLGISSLGSCGGQSYHDGIGLNFATGVYYRKPAGGVVTREALTSLFTFTGGNQSMYMGGAGLLVASATNTPRIEYSSTGVCLGLLMEAARTNLALHSSDFTNAAWVNTTTTTAKTSTGPDGQANSASRLTATGANSTRLQTVTSASATRVFSIWLKRITGTGNIDLTLDNGVGWTTKTITSSWAKYEITQAAVTNPVFGVRIVTNGDAIDVYGAQLESAAFSSSHIPTTTIAVARTADSCIRALSTEFNAAAGTVVVAGRASGGRAAVDQYAWTLNDNSGTFAEYILLYRVPNTETAEFRVTDGGVAQVPLDATFANSTAFKAATAWAANDFAYSFNAAAVLTDAVGTLPTLTHLGLGMYPGFPTLEMNGHIRTFDYYPTRLANTFLVSAST